MPAIDWTVIGALADIALAGVALYVTALHMVAHADDKRQLHGQTEAIRERYKDSAETLRKYASLSSPVKLSIIAIATVAKIAASLAKLG
jgi:hypothetical protein